MADEGVVIQPYWRSIYRHHRENVIGAEQHIAYLAQYYKWHLAA
jgi:peptide/nickel transport system substrate-binding protein